MKRNFKKLQKLLLPIGWLYGIVIQVRNWLYDLGIFKTEKFNVPVLAIGNLTLGGTGKTPFTMFLAQQLSAHFKRIAIVSRGYGRQSRGLQLVAAYGQIYLDAAGAGDEPLLMARSLPQCIVIVSEKRAAGIKLACDKFQSDLIILDDAFQHRSVHRDVNILLINAQQAWRGNHPIPAGTLREFKANYRRADMLVWTNLPPKKEPPVIIEGLPVFSSIPRPGTLRDARGKICGGLDELVNAPVLAFAGIANPQKFFMDMQENGLELRVQFPFSDHKIYRKSDMEKLTRSARQAGCKALLCTEKDMVKIRDLRWTGGQLPLYAVGLDMDVENSEQFIEKTIEKLKKRQLNIDK